MKNHLKHLPFVAIRKMLFVGISFLSFVAISAQTADAAVLYFYPDNIDVVAGESIVLEVRLDTEGKSVNAIDISGTVENGIIESVTTANSIIEIFIDASAKNQNSFRFAGGTPNGFIGSGIVGRINVTAVKPGPLSASFSDSSKLLSGEGVSLEGDTQLRDASTNVLEPSANHIIISSRSHPDQSKWYNKKDLNLHWGLEEGTEYSYLISLDPAAVPDETPDRPEGTLMWQGDIKIGGLNDGIYYFTLKRVGEGGIARYRAMIDTAAPVWLGVEESEGVPETKYKRFVSFLAKDDLSGVSHYEVKVDDGYAEPVIAPYVLPDEYIKIVLSAVDNAGNSTDQTLYGKTHKGIVFTYSIVALVVLGALVVLIRPVRKRIFTKENL